jgi:hypothetical protein
MGSPTEASHSVLVYLKNTHAVAIGSLFLIGASVYGVFISSVGFYWDDWPVIWVYNALGSIGVIRYFTGNRPASGWIYANLAPFLGISPVGWQAANVLVRCASSAGLYLLFWALWPRRRDVAWLVAALVLLYPGFTQQAIALTYLSQNLSFLCFVTSLLTTALAVARPTYRWLFVPVSLALGVVSYLITEYFIGLEFVRLVVIVSLTSAGGLTWSRKNLRMALLMWAPYAAAWVAYLVWRGFIFHEVHYGPVGDKNIGYLISRSLRNPIREMAALVSNGLHNIAMATVHAYARPFMAGASTPDGAAGILSWVVAALVVGTALYTLRRLRISGGPLEAPELSDKVPRGYLETGVLMSIVGLCFAGLPFVSGQTAFFASVLSFGDRFTLPFMLPASLMLAGLLAFRGTGSRASGFIVSLVLFVFSAFQVQSMNSYRHDWLTQKSLFWQLAWRAPGLKSGSSVLVDGLPESVGSVENAGLLNLLYNRDDSAGRLDYFIFDLRRSPGGKLGFRPGAQLNGQVRSFNFQGTAAQSMVSWLSPTGTLRVVTPPSANEVLRGSALCVNISHLSQPEEVIIDNANLPDGPLLKVFGSEPKHEWQYFYQKAELERQRNHWDRVALLGDEVRKQGYKPTDASEWFPFIDGYARAHRFRTAAEITLSMLQESPDALAPLSALWSRVSREGPSNSPELSETLSMLGGKLMPGDWR